MTDRVLLGIISLIVGAFSAALAHWLTRRRERVATTLDLFRSFYDPEMHRARVLAAQYLDHSEEPVSFDLLWDKVETRAVYESLTRLVYFWFETHHLAEQGMLQRNLARRLLRYPYAYWEPRLRKLCSDQRILSSADELPPDWVSLFDRDRGKLDWILRRG